MASVSSAGCEASLHLEPAAQQLWLVEHRNDSHGEDWSASAAHDAVVTSFAQGTLIVGGRASLPVVHIEAAVGACVQRRLTDRGAWLTIFDDLELPFECVLRGLDAAGSYVQQHTLDFPADPPASLVGRLASVRRRFAFGVRHRFGRLPRETHSYP